MEPVVLTGHSGRPYDYPIVNFVPGIVWNPYPANYAFIRLRHELGLGAKIDVLYFGETDNLAKRPMPPGHDRWLEALAIGVTHVLCRVNHGGQAARQSEEQDLIAAYNPPLNVQHRTGIAGQSGGLGTLGQVGLGLLGRRGIL